MVVVKLFLKTDTRMDTPVYCLKLGVGQKLDVCDVVYDTNGLRSAMKAMSEKHHPDLQSSFVVFPVQVCPMVV